MVVRYFLQVSLENINEAKQNHDNDKHSDKDEGIQIGAHVLQNYLEKAFDRKVLISNEETLKLLSLEAYTKYTDENIEEVLQSVNKYMHDDAKNELVGGVYNDEDDSHENDNDDDDDDNDDLDEDDLDDEDENADSENSIYDDKQLELDIVDDM